MAVHIKESNRNASIVFVDDGYEQTLANNEKAELDKYLPLDKRALSKLHEEGNEEEIEKQKTIIRLYRCSDNNGKYRVAEVKLNPLQQTDLDSEVRLLPFQSLFFFNSACCTVGCVYIGSWCTWNMGMGRKESKR